MNVNLNEFYEETLLFLFLQIKYNLWPLFFVTALVKLYFQIVVWK